MIPLCWAPKGQLPPHATCTHVSSVHSPFSSSAHLADPPLSCPWAFLSLNCYLQPPCPWDRWHRHVVVPFQALLTCLFFNETFLEKARCAGSLYFTDFSSTGLSSLFKNISNCHCIYHGTDRYFLPLLPLQYFYAISADTMTLFAKVSGLKTEPSKWKWIKLRPKRHESREELLVKTQQERQRGI